MRPGHGYWILVTEETDLTLGDDGKGLSIDLASPLNGGTVTAPTPVVGSVGGTTLADWTLAVRAPGAPDWTGIASGMVPVSNGTLGTIDPTLLLNGLAEVRLQATDIKGQSVSVSVFVVVEGGMKIGNLTLPFLDLELSLGALPIQVVRTYDSRDKRLGDFGIGWRLGFSEVSVRETVEAGLSWLGQRSGGPFPTYCIRPSGPHVLVVALPGGDVLRFAAAISPECQSLVPPRSVNVTYRTPRASRW